MRAAPRRRARRRHGRALGGAPRAASSSATRGCPGCWPSTAARWTRRRSSQLLRDEAERWSPEPPRRPRDPGRAGQAVTPDLRDEAPDAPAARALWEEYMALGGASASARPSRDAGAHLRHARRLRGPGSAWLVRLRRRRAGRLRRPAPPGRVHGRDQAHVRHRAAPAGAGTAARCWPSSSAARAAAGPPRVRLLTTEVLHEARGALRGRRLRRRGRPARGRPPGLLDGEGAL